MLSSKYPALVLNADFTPLRVHPLSTWGFERTMRNFLKDSIIPLEYYDDVLRSPSTEYQPPSVVALKSYVPLRNRVPFTRMNIFLRDQFRCQYCGDEFPSEELTFDHVVPRSRGGPLSFENIVSCCIPCNLAKGDKMIMKPIREPYTPTPRELMKIRVEGHKFHKTWLDYLYWSGVLEEQ